MSPGRGAPAASPLPARPAPRIALPAPAGTDRESGAAGRDSGSIRSSSRAWDAAFSCSPAARIASASATARRKSWEPSAAARSKWVRAARTSPRASWRSPQTRCGRGSRGVQRVARTRSVSGARSRRGVQNGEKGRSRRRVGTASAAKLHRRVRCARVRGARCAVRRGEVGEPCPAGVPAGASSPAPSPRTARRAPRTVLTYGKSGNSPLTPEQP